MVCQGNSLLVCRQWWNHHLQNARDLVGLPKLGMNVGKWADEHNYSAGDVDDAVVVYCGTSS